MWTLVVENNIAMIASWIGKFVEEETRKDIPQALKIARHFEQDFEKAQDVIINAFQDEKCPAYIYDAFNDAESYSELEMIIDDKLNKYLNTMIKDIKKR